MPTPISRADLLAKMEGPEPPVLIEALGAAYYDDAHLPGAVNIPPGEVDRLAPALIPDRRAPIVVYSSGSSESSLLAGRRLRQLGYEDVRIYEGGKEDWVENGLPVDRSGNGA